MITYLLTLRKRIVQNKLYTNIGDYLNHLRINGSSVDFRDSKMFSFNRKK